MRTLGYQLLAGALLVMGIAATSGARADDADTEVRRLDQLKAGYLFNFLKFTDWPASMPATFITVCFAGAEGVHAALATGIEEKRVGARRIALRKLEPSEPPLGCDALYVDARRFEEISLAELQQLPVLTISDRRGFMQEGGMIELFTEKNRLRFHINVTNVRRAGLRLSSGLLQLAATTE